MFGRIQSQQFYNKQSKGALTCVTSALLNQHVILIFPEFKPFPAISVMVVILL